MDPKEPQRIPVLKDIIVVHMSRQTAEALLYAAEYADEKDMKFLMANPELGVQLGNIAQCLTHLQELKR